MHRLNLKFALTVGLTGLLWLSHQNYAIGAETQAQPSKGQLQVVAETHTQPTGITVLKSGQVFLNFPRWQAPYQYAVAEVGPKGALKPFPNAEWNTWNPKLPPNKHFVCVQSVVADDQNRIWVLDPAAPQLGDVVKGGPKLLAFDPKSGKLLKAIYYNEVIAPQKSYLNDVRIDTRNNVAYITESGLGSIVVTDLNTGKSRRLLANHASTKAEPGFKLIVNGRDLRNDKGYVPQFNADGIALSSDNQYLYYHALTGETLYRIATHYLRDTSLSDEAISQYVETVGKTGPTDGMWLTDSQKLYQSSFPDNSVKRFYIPNQGPLTGEKGETVVQSSQLLWPDTFSQGSDGSLYVTASQIQNMPKFSGNKPETKKPQLKTYKVFRFKPAANP